MDSFELLKSEVFALFDTAEKPVYLPYNIYSKATEQIGDISNVRKVWRGDKTPKGNERSLPNTKANNEKLRAIKKCYETQLHIAIKSTREALDMEVNL